MECTIDNVRQDNQSVLSRPTTPKIHRVFTQPRPLADIIELENYPLGNGDFRTACKRALDRDGALVMLGFLKPAAVESIRSEGEAPQHLAYYTNDKHNIYLKRSRL